MSIQTVVGNAAAANRGVNTAIALVVDRSGSMHPYFRHVVDSVNQFITDQVKNKGKATLMVSQFDHEYEQIYKNQDIKEVDKVKNTFERIYSPRGSTSLRDAIVQAAADMDTLLSQTPAQDRPKKVVIALITDGDDNTSRESVDKVRSIVKEKSEKGWEFLLLGAEESTLNVAEDLGFSREKTAIYSADNVDGGIKLLSDKVTQARKGKKVEITQQERLALLGAPDRRKTDL